MTIYISDCYIYPMKSGKGIACDELDLTPRGPQGDRCWMLVDENGRFLSQRDKGCEKMALIETRLTNDGAVFSAPDMDDLVVSGEGVGLKEMTVWKDEFQAMDMGDEASAWFSAYLGREAQSRSCEARSSRANPIKAHLAKMPDDFNRSTDPVFSQQGDQVSFADGFPLLVTSKPSLDSLQEYFPPNVDITMDRFRPNIVLDGNEPFEEDVIYTAKIGEVELEFVKPCTRCKLTTVDQDTGDMPSNEPLATLTKLRCGASQEDGVRGVMFGQNAIARKLGKIKKGDKVEILSRRPLHPALEQCELKTKAQAV